MNRLLTFASTIALLAVAPATMVHAATIQQYNAPQVQLVPPAPGAFQAPTYHPNFNTSPRGGVSSYTPPADVAKDFGAGPTCPSGLAADRAKLYATGGC